MQHRRSWILPAAAALVLLGLGACSKTAPPVATNVPATAPVEATDDDVTTRVKTALLGDAELKAFDIAVVTTKGDVRMTGVLDTAVQVERARTLARGIDGVHALHDELAVKPGG